MKINGSDISTPLYNKLKENIKHLANKPTLLVMLVGDEVSSKIYIKQKQKFAKLIDAKVILKKYPSEVKENTLSKDILKFNKDSKINGIIIQQPLPTRLNTHKLLNLIEKNKEVDGLSSDSPYIFPVSRSILLSLDYIHKISHDSQPFKKWLEDFKIVIIGKGPTGGKPIINTLTKANRKLDIIDSKTKNPEKIYSHADVVITAVGKTHILNPKYIKRGAILIGVGQYRSSTGKLSGDFSEESILSKVSYYTPTPGGIGHLTVYSLLENLVRAATIQNKL